MAGDVVNLDALAKGDDLRLRTYGVGSAGCNMVAASRFPSVAFSTSSADAERSGSERRLVVTTERLTGLYQTDSKITAQMPSVLGNDLLGLFGETDAAYLMSGLGGVAGSVGAVVLGQAARSRCPLTVSAVAMPFSAESERRRSFALKCSRRIMSSVDLCLVFTNDALSSLAPHMPLSKALDVLNGIMLRPAIEMSNVLGRANAGAFAEAIGSSSHGSFGLGMARGDDRVSKVIEEALASPWFDFAVADAEAAVAIYSAADPWDKELAGILEGLRVAIPSARIATASYMDAGLRDRIRLSLTLCRKPPGGE
jgi:cell division protein FtsZ